MKRERHLPPLCRSDESARQSKSRKSPSSWPRMTQAMLQVSNCSLMVAWHKSKRLLRSGCSCQHGRSKERPCYSFWARKRGIMMHLPFFSPTFPLVAKRRLATPFYEDQAGGSQNRSTNQSSTRTVTFIYRCSEFSFENELTDRLRQTQWRDDLID